MIFFVSKTLTHNSGLPQAGKDILIALLTTGEPIIVVTKTKCLLPQKIENQLVPLPQWVFPIEKIASAKSIQRKRQLLSFLIQWIQKKILEIIKNQRDKQLKAYNPHRIVVNGLSNHTFWQNISPEVTEQMVLIVHVSPRHFVPPKSETLDWAIKIMNQYKALIFVSSRCRDEWSSLIDVSNKRISYIPNCCKEDEIKKITSVTKEKTKEKLSLSLKDFVAVCVASLQPRKNQTLLLDVFPKLIQIVPNLKLYLIGPISLNPSWAKSLLKTIKVKGFSNQIQYLGSKENAKEFIYAADVLLLPSLAEAMPCVILEAMALKTPIIASEVDGIPELIENESTGFLFSPKDPQTLVEAFKKMANNLEETQKYTDNAYHKYWQEFSQSKQIERYHRFLANLNNGN
ncbi:glycosyl transferase, group 1 [Crocosphaera subtropica ATCC 51142]|uniref:Glycosyl transferase, group 1 n=1 Tax=Crocosphaera subtropica (strain ATCC 51142 / BH68) TaxID=43989 RepID=B1WVB6_CROS5|nr:glycosyltransferase family 4 protein [Crocosphaera subtropica]ACB53906.1 glycosyl transferase, group 1 [Crocosphaera subtropica ATCC 51142]